jgi:hypothetical protein
VTGVDGNTVIRPPGKTGSAITNDARTDPDGARTVTVSVSPTVIVDVAPGMSV